MNEPARREVQDLHIFLGIETTGQGHACGYPREDAIVEIGLAYRLSGEMYAYSWLCRPDQKYLENGRADEALSISHISLDEIHNAPTDSKIALKVKGVLAYLTNPLTNSPKKILHSYNMAFVRPFLQKSPWHFEYEWGEDPMLMAMDIINPVPRTFPSLSESMGYLGILRIGWPHAAQSDAIAAMEVYEACMKIKYGEDYFDDK